MFESSTRNPITLQVKLYPLTSSFKQVVVIKKTMLNHRSCILELILELPRELRMKYDVKEIYKNIANVSKLD